MRGGQRSPGAADPGVIVTGTCSGIPPRVQPPPALADIAPRCGNLGQACCVGGACEAAYQCDAATARCVDPLRPAYLTSGLRCTGGGATPHSKGFYIGVRDSDGCGEVASVLADSEEEARACARVRGGRRVTEAAIRRYDFCRDGRVRVYVAAFSPDDAERCAHHLWPNAALDPGLCTANWSDERR